MTVSEGLKQRASTGTGGSEKNYLVEDRGSTAKRNDAERHCDFTGRRHNPNTARRKAKPHGQDGRMSPKGKASGQEEAGDQ